jgi:hypothetical protein
MFYLGENVGQRFAKINWRFLQLFSNFDGKPFSTILRNLFSTMTIEDCEETTIRIATDLVNYAVH